MNFQPINGGGKEVNGVSREHLRPDRVEGASLREQCWDGRYRDGATCRAEHT